jgi:type III secretion protein L
VFLVVDKGKLASSATPIVKASDYQSWMQAQELVPAASRRAELLKEAAAREIEQIRAKAYAEASAAARADFAATIVETTSRIEAAFVGLEARIVNTVLNAVQQILGEMDDIELMKRLIRRVLTQTRSHKSLRLRAAEADFEIVKTALGEVLKEFPDVDFIDIVKDARCERDTCVLESDYGAIDASIATQITAIRRGLVDSFVGKRRPAVGAQPQE